MEKRLRLVLSSALLFSLPLIHGTTFAAKPINLDHQNASVLQSFISSPTAAAIQGLVKLEEIGRTIDHHQTVHVRVQETYSNYPVWGADAIIHIPQGANTAKSMVSVVNAAKMNHGFMNGILYQDLNADLASAPKAVFSQTQAQKVMEQAINTYQHKMGGKVLVKEQQNKLMIFVDKNNKAHWVYQISFIAPPATADRVPAKPTYIMDALSFQVYAEWDGIETVVNAQSLDDTLGGGFGGNPKMGKLIYDGLTGDLPALSIQREATGNTCYLKNGDVTVKKCTSTDWWGQCKKSIEFKLTCDVVDPNHNNVYWNGDMDQVNDGYSPSNDALFNGAVIKDMYQKWYKIPVLVQNGKPMMLNMIVHLPMDNAYWDGSTMNFGDGITLFYPLTSLSVAAHEISHGFTEQHSKLYYGGQSGGMNESFSDMAAQAAELYAYNKNSWQIGPEIFKAEGEALRYMDEPSKDCKGRQPGSQCSIDKASQYYEGLNVHYSSGVYNHFFYLLGTTSGWDAKKAFEVMIHANSDYWTSTTDFTSGACGVVKAAQALDYDVTAVKNAFTAVEIKTDDC